MTDLFHGKPVYLFGCNEHSKELSGVIQVTGIIDDFQAGSNFVGVPVFHGDSIDPNSIIINCVLMAKGRLLGL